MSLRQNPVFFKEVPLQLRFQGDFILIFFATGFSKAVDPMSGMTVNLMNVVQWQSKFKDSLKSEDFGSWFDFFQRATLFFQNKAQSEQAELKALQVRLFDGRLLRQDAEGLFLTKSDLVTEKEKVFIRKTKREIKISEDFERDGPKTTELLDPETGISKVF